MSGFGYVTNPDNLIAYLSIEDQWEDKGYGKLYCLHTNPGGIRDDDGKVPPFILHRNGYIHSFVNQDAVDFLLKEGRIVLLKDYESGKSYGVPGLVIERKDGVK